jgi:predicted NBD/HSP70 family sugar kinase
MKSACDGFNYYLKNKSSTAVVRAMKASSLSLYDEEKRLLWHLRTHGPAPRSELATALQISNAAVTKLSRNLLTLGLIEEEGVSLAQGRGRPTVPLRVSPEGGYAVGATVHKGVLEIAVVDYAGGVISLTSEKVEAPDPHDFAKRLDRRIHELAIEHRLLGRRLLGVGLGVPGPALSRDGNRWSVVHALPGWRDVPLRQIMDETLGLPVWIENDATAAALAEYYLGGLLQRCSTAVVFLLGYGIGAGIVHEGRLLRGEMGNAGEIGTLYPIDRPRPSTLDLLSVLRAEGCDIVSLADFERQTQGHGAVIERWLDRAAKQLELTVNSAIAWFDPGAIMLSSPLPGTLITRLADRLNGGKLVWGDHRTASLVEASRLGGASTALGAALLPIHASIAPG